MRPSNRPLQVRSYPLRLRRSGVRSDLSIGQALRLADDPQLAALARRTAMTLDWDPVAPPRGLQRLRAVVRRMLRRP